MSCKSHILKFVRFIHINRIEEHINSLLGGIHEPIEGTYCESCGLPINRSKRILKLPKLLIISVQGDMTGSIAGSSAISFPAKITLEEQNLQYRIFGRIRCTEDKGFHFFCLLRKGEKVFYYNDMYNQGIFKVYVYDQYRYCNRR